MRPGFEARKDGSEGKQRELMGVEAEGWVGVQEGERRRKQ